MVAVLIQQEFRLNLVDEAGSESFSELQIPLLVALWTAKLISRIEKKT